MIGMWFVAFIILLFFEIITVNLVTIWFAIGALVSCVVAYFCDNIFIQIGVFLLTSIIVLVCTKPLSQKIRKGKKVATNSDRVIGMEGVVTMDISKNNVGEVKVDGKRWSAVSKEEFHKDDIVVIKKIDGVKLIVEKEVGNPMTRSNSILPRWNYSCIAKPGYAL